MSSFAGRTLLRVIHHLPTRVCPISKDDDFFGTVDGMPLRVDKQVLMLGIEADRNSLKPFWKRG